MCVEFTEEHKTGHYSLVVDIHIFICFIQYVFLIEVNERVFLVHEFVYQAKFDTIYIDIVTWYLYQFLHDILHCYDADHLLLQVSLNRSYTFTR